MGFDEVEVTDHYAEEIVEIVCDALVSQRRS